MKKYMKYVTTFIVGIVIATFSHASQDLAQDKEYTFYITISEQNNPIDRSTYPAENSDEFASKIFGMSWPKDKNEKIWPIIEENLKWTIKGDSKQYPWWSPLPLEDLSNTVEKNIFHNKHIEKFVIFPHALSDVDAQKLVREKKVTLTLETGTKLHLVLGNDLQSQQKLVELILQKPKMQSNHETKSSFVVSLFGSVIGLSIIACLLKNYI